MDLNKKSVREPFPGFWTISELAIKFGRETRNLSCEDFVETVRKGFFGKKAQRIAQEIPLSPLDPFPGFRASIEAALRLGWWQRNRYRRES